MKRKAIFSPVTTAAFVGVVGGGQEGAQQGTGAAGTTVTANRP